MNKKKKKSGFSVLDAVILLLVLALAGTVFLRDPIRRFLGEESEETVQYIFTIKDVTAETISRPQVGETLTLLQGSDSIGRILSISETSYDYTSDVDGTITLYKLTCTAEVTLTKTETGYRTAGVQIKPGAVLSAKTETASFQMTIIDVNTTKEN